AAVRLLDDPDALTGWQAALNRLADRDDTHPLLSGDAVRRLRDASVLDGPEVERRLGLALSSGVPLEVTAWLDGFLGDSGALLIHDPVLLTLLDDWLVGLDGPVFTQTLPLLRRVFSRFDRPERRAIGEALRGGNAAARGPRREVNAERALRAVPVVLNLLGVNA
ncbi:DUF5682 family protein, partial [Deinococcus aquaticus]|uniref:DUF5682 family protein n=1 Tax=Deinococcus aquaticus TaxID=328692 RepID=UPI003F46D73F